jgi:hypothetical protein
MKVVVNETFTPPLSDATPLVQKIRADPIAGVTFIVANWQLKGHEKDQ